MKKYNVDWNDIKARFISSQLSRTEFKEQIPELKEMSPIYFLNKTKPWEEERSKLQKKAYEKSEEKIFNKMVDKYSDYVKLWKAVRAQAGAILKSTIRPDGTMNPMSPNDLRSLAASIDIALKGDRLVNGETTENINLNEGSLHMHLVKVIKGINEGTYTPPQSINDSN